jgi:chromosomal replication initiator protein
MIQNEQLTAVWNKILSELETVITPITFKLYISTLEPIDIKGNKIVLSTKSEYFANTLTERLVSQIKKAILKADTYVSDFELCVGKSKEDFLTLKGYSNGEGAYDSSNVDSKFTFDSFVVGNSNKFVYAAAKAVAENPGISFNPLFIYGGSGLGKTHIMQAVANHIMATRPEKKVVYITCEKFTNELIDSIRHNKCPDFRAHYRNIDVLIIDDVQFLANKEACQEEFFHTFNELYSQNKQIILSSDSAPSEIKLLNERLRTRFEGGMTADVQPPDIETKIAILQKKAAEKKYIIDRDVLNYLAENSGNDIRTLEGRLTKVIFASILHECPITIELAENALKDSVSETGETLTTSHIINSVASFFNIKNNELLGKKKNKELVEPRQICTYLICELMDLPLVTIGTAMGGRDHTTVIHSRNKITELIKNNDRMAKTVNDIKNIILKK